MNTDKLLRTINRILRLLVAREYRALEKMTSGKRLTAKELERAIQDYGNTLVMPNESTLNYRGLVEVTNSSPRKWSLYVDLWTIEEGKSDLTLELSITDNTGDIYAVELDDVHVL